MFKWLKNLFGKRVAIRLEENTPRKAKTIMPQMIVENEPAKIFRKGNVFHIHSKDRVFKLELTKIIKGRRFAFRLVG